MEDNNQIHVNDGKGLWDKYGLIQLCVDDLCALHIRVDELSTNGVVIVDVINRLKSLAHGLHEDDERMKKKNETKPDDHQTPMSSEELKSAIYNREE